MTDQPMTVDAWWTMLNDLTLDGLVLRAVRQNLTLRQAEARLREARAARAVTGAGQYPAVNLNGFYARSRGSENGPRTGPGAPDRETDLYQPSFDASWELDLFGGVRRSVEAADADVEAADEARRDALLSLLAEVARAYVDLRTAQRQAAIARDNLQAQHETLDVTRSRERVGLTTDLDIIRADGQVQATESQVPLYEAAADDAVGRLAILLAQYPGDLDAELAAAKPAAPASPPPEVPVGLPSELLRRRPDVRRAERQLAAATARVGVATADLYPRLSLTGSFGSQTLHFARVADYSSAYWLFGPSVRWPVFDAGRVRAQIKVADARTDAALAGYELAVLTALAEVENAASAYVRQQQRRQSLAASAESNRVAVRLAQDLYKEGLGDFLGVLDAQRSLYAAEDALAQSDRAVASSLVALYKALGGGWGAAESLRR